MEITELRKENANLKKMLHQLSRHSSEPPDSENSRLLERILALETIREKNSQQLLSKDEEIDTLRRQLYRRGGKAVESQQDHIDHCFKEMKQRDKLIQALQTETEELKNKLAATSAKCEDLESRGSGCEGPSGQESSSTIRDQLRDALEKNQQWLAYDQQREAYVKATVARVSILEQQLIQASETLSQQHNEALSVERRNMAQMQQHYDSILLRDKKEMDTLREQVNTALMDLNKMQQRYEEKQKEADHMEQQLQAERLSIRKNAQEERHRSGERESRLKAEMENLQARLGEEKQRSAELLLQVKLMRKSMDNQQEEQKTISILEQQIQVMTRELEDEKQERLHSQKQLCRVLKELHRTKGQVAKLSEKEQRQSCSSEAGRHNRQSLMSSPRSPNVLDESFLECPGCSAQYPSSQHRELLAHIDHCLD